MDTDNLSIAEITVKVPPFVTEAKRAKKRLAERNIHMQKVFNEMGRLRGLQVGSPAAKVGLIGGQKYVKSGQITKLYIEWIRCAAPDGGPECKITPTYEEYTGNEVEIDINVIHEPIFLNDMYNI